MINKESDYFWYMRQENNDVDVEPSQENLRERFQQETCKFQMRVTILKPVSFGAETLKADICNGCGALHGELVFVNSFVKVIDGFPFPIVETFTSTLITKQEEHRFEYFVAGIGKYTVTGQPEITTAGFNLHISKFDNYNLVDLVLTNELPIPTVILASYRYNTAITELKRC
ncbi:hypothetical protein [Ectobacillus funiculus]|uniref:SipL SPOCS domain-containing protein n=1 Tax=Ectobacillus funiculus TaxID=137993 RepID=A0ABV5WGR8_9BACI